MMNEAKMQKRNNNFAFAGYIIGLVALLLCWVPYAGLMLSIAAAAFLTVAWILGKNRRKGFLLVGTIAVAVAFLFGCNSSLKATVAVYDEIIAPMHPSEAFEVYCDSAYADYSRDTGGLTVDTNPTDEPGGEQTAVYEVIRQLNNEYALTDEQRQQMKAVTENDGWQSCETEHNLVMWNYHPDRGFEVIYYEK